MRLRRLATARAPTPSSHQLVCARGCRAPPEGPGVPSSRMRRWWGVAVLRRWVAAIEGPLGARAGAAEVARDLESKLDSRS